MNEFSEHLPMIEAYLEGSLSLKDRKAVEERRANEPAFDAAIIEFERIKQAIEIEGQRKMRLKIGAWEQDARKDNSSYRRAFSMAAAVLVILGLGLLLVNLLWRSEPEPEQLAASMFDPYPSMVGERNAGSMEAIDSLLMHYEAGQYQMVLESFEGRMEEGMNQPNMMSFYMGESYLATNNFAEAAVALGQFTDRDNALFETARFHTALALVLNGDRAEAEKALTIIFAEKGPYREKAEDLLNSLNALDDLAE